MLALVMDNVSKRFESPGRTVVAVDRLSLDIERGKILGLLGPNGSGKTTATKMACRLLIPDSGNILVLGQQLAKYHSQLLGRLGVLLEPGKGLYKNKTALENLRYWAIVKGLHNRREIDRRAGELLAFFELEDKKVSLVSTLSAGMGQKLSLCCALITRPELLLLDEPNVAMDVESSSALVGKLRQLAREQGCAILVTSHQMDFMEELCDDVAFISAGRLLHRGPREHVRWLFRQKHYKLVLKPLAPGHGGIDASEVNFPGVLSVRNDLPEGMVELNIDSASTRPETLVMLAVERSLEVVRLELVQPSLKECYQRIFAGGVPIDTS